MKGCILALLVVCGLLVGACSDHSPELEGTYVAPIIPDVFETASFYGNTLELCNPRDGTRVFEYEIIEDGTKIKMTNVETGDCYVRPFKHILVTTEYGEKRETVVIDQFIYYPQ